MASSREGSIRLLHVAGVDVFLHWSWFLVAIYEIQTGNKRYSSVGWNIAEYLALFLIVTLHEFGHAMACRQVGGTANRIVLWPLGGTAYVDPPPRPGALPYGALLRDLWSTWRCSRSFTAHCYWADRPAGLRPCPICTGSCGRFCFSMSSCWCSTCCPFTRWTAGRFSGHFSGLSSGEAGVC
jgi:hypothetical protein